MTSFLGAGVPGVKKTPRRGPDIFPFRVLYSSTPGVAEILRAREYRRLKKAAWLSGAVWPLRGLAFLRRRWQSIETRGTKQPSGMSEAERLSLSKKPHETRLFTKPAPPGAWQLCPILRITLCVICPTSSREISDAPVRPIRRPSGIVV